MWCHGIEKPELPGRVEVRLKHGSEKALSVLQSIDRGKWRAPALKLTRLIKSPNLRILVIHSSDSRAAAPLEPGPGFTITPLTKEDILSGQFPEENQIFLEKLAKFRS